VIAPREVAALVPVIPAVALSISPESALISRAVAVPARASTAEALIIWLESVPRRRMPTTNLRRARAPPWQTMMLTIATTLPTPMMAGKLRVSRIGASDVPPAFPSFWY